MEQGNSVSARALQNAREPWILCAEL